MPPTKRPRLSDDSPAVRRLHQMFDCGELTGDEAASDVQNMDRLFEPFLPATFKNKYQKIRDLKCNEDDRVRRLLKPRCSAGPSMANKAVFNVDYDETEEKNDLETGLEEQIAKKSKPELLEFFSLVLKSMWDHEVTMTKNESLAILLPSRVLKSAIHSHVVKNGKMLELVVDWPDMMTDSPKLFKFSLAKQFDPLKPYNPKIGGFNKALKELRKERSQKIQSFCAIDLPFVVDTYVPLKQVINFGDGLLVLYIELKAPDDKYAKKDDIDEVIVN